MECLLSVEEVRASVSHTLNPKVEESKDATLQVQTFLQNVSGVTFWVHPTIKLKYIKFGHTTGVHVSVSDVQFLYFERYSSSNAKVESALGFFRYSLTTCIWCSHNCGLFEL